jgi:hypothetical protein
MHGNVPFAVASATEINRRQCQDASRTDARGSVANFGRHAKLAWPFKTAAHVASIAGTSERQAARMLTGEFEPPASVIAALIVEITKRN